VFIYLTNRKFLPPLVDLLCGGDNDMENGVAGVTAPHPAIVPKRLWNMQGGDDQGHRAAGNAGNQHKSHGDDGNYGDRLPFIPWGGGIGDLVHNHLLGKCIINLK
jgi:hypothetical protein